VHHTNILVYKSQQDAQITEFIFLRIALHVSGFTIIQLQEHKPIVTTASGNRYTALLSAAIVEDFQIFHDSSRQQYGTYIIIL
jgi:hypothetical protein